MNDYTVLIPELRSAMNITQEDLAKLLGVTSVSVSRWENGKTIPTKIIKAPPFPIPFSVISSDIHITRIEPAVKVTTDEI